MALRVPGEKRLGWGIPCVSKIGTAGRLAFIVNAGVHADYSQLPV